MNKILSSFFLLLFIVTAAYSQRVTFDCTLKNSPRQKVYLLTHKLNDKRCVDSTYVDSLTGKFTLSYNAKEEYHYKFRFEKQPPYRPYWIPAMPNETLTIVDDANIVGNWYSISGSECAEEHLEYMKFQVHLGTVRRKFNDSLKVATSEEIVRSLKDSIKKTDALLVNSYLKRTKSKYATTAWSGLIGLEGKIDSLDVVAADVLKRFPNDPDIVNYQKWIELTKPNRHNAYYSTLMGKPLPPIMLKDTAGNVIDIKLLAGKPAIIDFWASWCAPCKVKIAELKKLKAKYQSSLNIYAISIDKDLQKWKKAITESQTQHFTHVVASKDINRDLLDFFKVDAIPLAIFINSKGEITGVNLSEAELVSKIEQDLKIKN